jgi:hypothetical protein
MKRDGGGYGLGGGRVEGREGREGRKERVGGV